MLGNITIGQYFPGNSPLHRMDPRAKLILTVLMVVVVFLASSPLSYIALFGAVLGVIALSGIRFHIVVRALKPVALVIALTFVLNVLFTPSGTPVFKWAFITITDDGLAAAAYMAMRLTLLVISTQMLTLTTSPIALTDGLERLMKPLSKIGFPAHELAMMMSIALRFIPTLLEETGKIKKAQMARGADFESGNIIKRVLAMIPLLVPLFVSAFRRADDLALAMEARCYRGGEHRTRMKVLKYTRVDAWAALWVVALGALVLAL